MGGDIHHFHNSFQFGGMDVVKAVEPSETPGIGIVLVKSRTFWASIPGIGIGIVGSEKPRPVSVSVPFNILDWDQSRYRSRSISQTGTSLNERGTIQFLMLSNGGAKEVFTCNIRKIFVGAARITN